MAEKTAVPVQGAVEIVIADSVIHANKRHPDLTLEDWSRLPGVTNAFDDASLGQPGPNQNMARIVVRKSTQADGSGYGAVYDFAAGGNKGRKKLNLVTYFRGTEKSLNSWWEKNKGADPAAVPNLPEPASSARDDVSAPSDASLPPTAAAAQPITRADVEAAQQQAAAIIGARIDAMTAGEVNTIAKKFLPTMGMKPTMSKANNKAAMTDPKINLEAAAAEVGATLPAEVTRALQADMEGRVADAQADAAEQPTKKLTPSEAKSLMEWQDLGQKDGVKTHALTFYESQADKDAKRGRMIVAKVSKGDRSATAWMVDGEDKTFGMLAQAKKRAEEVGMARAVADGFVEGLAAGREVVDTSRDQRIGKDINGNDVFMGSDGALKGIPYIFDERGRPKTGVAMADPAKAAAPAAPIEDFGEKLEGARKDMPPSLKEDVSDEQIASLPLSKVWPSDAHESIEDDVAAALTFAARQEIPSKPRVPGRVRSLALEEAIDFPVQTIERYTPLAEKHGLHLQHYEMRDLKIHDLRRTLGSWLASNGTSLPIIGRVLNHKTPEATKVYARLIVAPVRNAMEEATAAMRKIGEQ